MDIIQPIVVIYNATCAESPSIMALLKQGLKPLVIDNSTANYNNDSFCLLNNIPYYSMGENAGLSRAYNKALSLIDENVKYVLWMDDDTTLPDNYRESLTVSIVENANSDVLIPIVKSNNNTNRDILSPSIIKSSHTFRPDSVDEFDDHEISAINSGMLVKRTVYDGYRYDEKLFLDCIDHDFVAWCYKNNKHICVLKEIILQQSFSSDEKASRRNRLQRYKIFAKDYKYYRKKNHLSTIQTYFYLAKRLVSALI